MFEEVLFPFYYEEYATPKDTLIKGGPHKYKTAYCFKESFPLGSKSAQIAHKEIKKFKSQGYTLIDIADASIEEIQNIQIYFEKDKLELYKNRWNILVRIENFIGEKFSGYARKEITDEELLSKEQNVLSKLDFQSLNDEKKEAVYELLKELKNAKIKSKNDEYFLNQLDKYSNKEVKPSTK